MSTLRAHALPRVHLFLGVLCLLAIVSCNLRMGNDVLIPTGFKGWVTIRYQHPGSQPLQRPGLRRLINVPMSGEVFTSSSKPTGYGTDHYYFVAVDGKRTLIKADDGFNGCPEFDLCVQKFEYYSGAHPATVFFVGSKHEMSNYKSPDIN